MAGVKTILKQWINKKKSPVKPGSFFIGDIIYDFLEGKANIMYFLGTSASAFVLSTS